MTIYQIELGGDELMQKEDGSYLKTLQLDPLSEKDAGLYICLGTNRYGYSIEKTYLNVKPSKSISRLRRSNISLIALTFKSVTCGRYETLY